MSLPGRWRWCDRPCLCDARKEQNALHTLIHQRRLTPSCGGFAPTAERTMDPARIFTESLTPQNRSFGNVGSMSGLPKSGHDWAIYEYMPELDAARRSRALSRVRPTAPPAPRRYWRG